MKIDENRIREIVAESLKALSEETNVGQKKKHKNSKQIESYFKKKGVNCAPYAYKLFHVKAKEGKDSVEMKNARGLFMKKLNHETNEYGNPYKFTSGELNRLQSLISNAQLSEAVDNAVTSVIDEMRYLQSTTGNFVIPDNSDEEGGWQNQQTPPEDNWRDNNLNPNNCPPEQNPGRAIDLEEAIDKAFDTVLNEGLEEGWFNNAVNTVKGAVQGAQMGYNQAKYTDQASGNLNNNGPANSIYEKMIASVQNSQDAAMVYGKLMRTAALYAGQAKQLRAKMKEIGAAHDIQRTQNRQANGQFGAKGFTEKDNGTAYSPSSFDANKAATKRDFSDSTRRMTPFSAGGMQAPGARGTAGMGYFQRRFNEAVENAIYETLIEEGLWSNLKSAWKGMKQGAAMQRALGTDAKADYANDAKMARDRALGRETATYNAKDSIQKYAEMAKEYDAIAAQLRTQAQALKAKWNIVRSNVGQAGPAQYGYSKNQPQAQPGVANNPAPAQASSQLAETGDLDNIAPEDEIPSQPVTGTVS